MAMCLSCKHEDLSSTPRIHFNKIKIRNKQTIKSQDKHCGIGEEQNSAVGQSD